MHRLALALGRTVSELEDSLTSSELSDWIDYYQVEPWGAWRDNWHAAILACLLSGEERPDIQQYLYRYVEPVIDGRGRASESAIDGVFGL